jgi:hypothetical protein
MQNLIYMPTVLSLNTLYFPLPCRVQRCGIWIDVADTITDMSQ